jgi:hypothetical protein
MDQSLSGLRSNGGHRSRRRGDRDRPVHHGDRRAHGQTRPVPDDGAEEEDGHEACQSTPQEKGAQTQGDAQARDEHHRNDNRPEHHCDRNDLDGNVPCRNDAERRGAVHIEWLLQRIGRILILLERN